MKKYTAYKLFGLLASICLALPHVEANTSQTRVNIQDSYQDILGQFSQVDGLLKASLPLDALFIVDQLPFTISQPGKYSVTQDLVYNASGPAITVAADNVSINFHNHTLTLNDANSVGIYVKDAHEFTLENEVIQSTSSTALHLANVNKASVNNIYTKSSTNGVTIENCQDIQLFSSQFALGGGIVINGSSHITIDSCTFNGINSAYGFHVEGPSEEIIITNSTFNDCLSSIHAINVNGMLIDNCHLTASPSSNLNLVQLGSQDDGYLANNIIIRNSTFTQNQAIAGFNGILALAGSGCLFENLVINTSSSDLAEGYASSAIHIGYQDHIPYQNLLAKNCIITGANPRAILVEYGEKIVFDECQISGASLYNLELLNATSCTIKNCMIFDGDSGIYMDSSSGGGNNSVRDCFVFNNKTSGIQVADMAKNNVSGNTVWGSQTGIQIAFSDYTEAFFNISCNNSVQNCSNVYPSQTPGGSDDKTSAVAGANLCCDDP